MRNQYERIVNHARSASARPESRGLGINMSVLVFDSVTDELQHLADMAGRIGDPEGEESYLRYLGHIRLLEANGQTMQGELDAIQQKLKTGQVRNAELAASIQLGKKLLGQARFSLNKGGKLAKAIRSFLNYADTNPIMVQAIAAQSEQTPSSSCNEDRQDQALPITHPCKACGRGPCIDK